MAIIDGDGHVFELRGTAKTMVDYLPDPYRHAQTLAYGVFPEMDHLHNEPVQMIEDAGNQRVVGPAEWSEFLEDVGIEATVMYPTSGLGIGTMPNPDWALAICQAYNDWLHAEYLKINPAFNGMALLPLQDPQAAVDELRRAVTELGMLGAMLPSNGLPSPLGAKAYWPVYAEADRLGCALAIHGGSGSRLGMDQLGIRPGAHALAHPFGLLLSLTSLVFNGVFDRFPGLRMAFLEGGAAWFLVAWERFDRSYSTHMPFNPRGELLDLPEGQNVAGYLSALAEAGRLMIGCEGDEPDLVRGVECLGSGAFMFSSDFPHEVSPQMCKEEIAELQERPDLTDAQKDDILGEAARRFYPIPNSV